jgi:hypothetical protein
MIDIFDIKEPLNSFPILWQALYAIPVAFVFVFLWMVLKKWQTKKVVAQAKIVDPKEYANEKLAMLSISDPRFVQKLDFIVRKYLELTGIIVK